jgi:hypothetical protein
MIMQRSGLEVFLSGLLLKLRVFARYHDRAVLLGLCLALIPIFPACFLGFLLSALNLALIWSGITSKDEISLAAFGCLAGFAYTLLWIIFMPSLISGLMPGSYFLWAIENFLNGILGAVSKSKEEIVAL